MNQNDIYVIYGSTPQTMVLELLRQIKPELEMDTCFRIGIKPNLVVAKPADSGATTSPQLVAGVIEYLKSMGFKDICILEGSWVGERTSRAFKVCGYEELSKRYGVPLIDLQKDGYREYEVGDIKVNICDRMQGIDYLINIPVLKGHCQTKLTCALKNMKGCIPDSEKRRFHTLGLHRPIAALNKALKQDLILVDGLMGDLNFEEGGHPVQMNRILAARDPVLVDCYAAALMGYDQADIPYLHLAASIGVGSDDLGNAVVHELNNDQISPEILNLHKFQGYAEYIEEQEACSACYGSLVHALERLREYGNLSKIKSKLYIGQYFKEKCLDGIGIGSCTMGFAECVRGCPPKARDIVAYLEGKEK
jgi:uncharacterized protein (DUF362 family)